mmetsp:Transcript_24702/g.58624  ORF Transcript_24702/g.58624 Transcript_24702/m.58624 type:complete len:467 (+) Transcript_24702:108-1508(+)
MRDSDLVALVPAWGGWKKSKRESIYQEYFRFSLSSAPEDEAEFERLVDQSKILEKQIFIARVPGYLDNRDAIGLTPTMEWWHELDEEEGGRVFGDLWDSAGQSVINGLDARDGMIQMHHVTIIKFLVARHGRALRKIRRSPKLVPWIKSLLDADTNSGRMLSNMMAIPALQYEVYVVLKCVFIGANEKLVWEMVKNEVPQSLFSKIRQCCPSVIAPYGEAVEEMIHVFAKYNILDKDRRMKVAFEVGNQLICNRCLQFDLTKERFDSRSPGPPIDVGRIAGAFVHMLQMMALELRIQTPSEVRAHLGKFGSGYTIQEPRHPLERERWSNRYACRRVAETDFASDMGQMSGSLIKPTNETRRKMFEDLRSYNISCGNCGKVEEEDVEQFNKCSRCKIVYYCGRECQKKHWKSHKKTCRKPDKQSLPDAQQSLLESITSSFDKYTEEDSNVEYPSVFGVWLSEKYGKE